jgi:hypothetical protein
MRNFVIGIAVGAVVTIAIVDHLTSRSTLMALRESRPASIKSATTESICGRNTFNILVDVARFQAVHETEQKVLAAEINLRLDRLADELRNRLERAGLRHDSACPVILNVFGWLKQTSPVRWTVDAFVRLDQTRDTGIAYPTWDSGSYNVWWSSQAVAQDDLEKALFERVQRFSTFFGKQEDGPATPLEPKTGKP